MLELHIAGNTFVKRGDIWIDEEPKGSSSMTPVSSVVNF